SAALKYLYQTGSSSLDLAAASVTAALSALVVSKKIGLLSKFQSQPWLCLAAGIVGLNLFSHISHLFLHKTSLIWKFHSVHHSDFEVDVTTAIRQHPSETLWRTFWQCLGAALGLPFWIVPVYLSLSSLNALLEHASVRVGDRFDRWLRLLIVMPNM